MKATLSSETSLTFSKLHCVISQTLGLIITLDRNNCDLIFPIYYDVFCCSLGSTHISSFRLWNHHFVLILGALDAGRMTSGWIHLNTVDHWNHPAGCTYDNGYWLDTMCWWNEGYRILFALPHIASPDWYYFASVILICLRANQSGRLSKKRTVLEGSKTWGRGFESYSEPGHMCACLYNFALCKRMYCDGPWLHPRNPTEVYANSYFQRLIRTWNGPEVLRGIHKGQ
jgi:hypothetical protein